MALIEYDQDYITYLTTAGLKAQMETSTEVTQHGSIKVHGTKFILDSVPDSPQTSAYIKKLKVHVQQYLSHTIGLRPLAMEITKLLQTMQGPSCDLEEQVAEQHRQGQGW